MNKPTIGGEQPAYLSLPRVVFHREVLPQGALPRFTDRSVTATSLVISKRGCIPTAVVEAEELFVPTIELRTSGTKKSNLILGNRYKEMSGMRRKAEVNMLADEDEMFLSLLDGMYRIPTHPTPHYPKVYERFTAVKGLNSTALVYLADAFSRLEMDGFEPSTVVCHPSFFWRLSMMVESKHFFVNRRNEIRKGFVDIPTDTTLRGYFFGVPIYANPYVPVASVYVFGEPKRVGAFPVRNDTVGVFGTVKKKTRVGYWGFQEMGLGILDCDGVWRVDFHDDALPPMPVKQRPSKPTACGTSAWDEEILDLLSDSESDTVKRIRALVSEAKKRAEGESYHGWDYAPDGFNEDEVAWGAMLDGQTDYLIPLGENHYLTATGEINVGPLQTSMLVSSSGVLRVSSATVEQTDPD